jgi:aminoglycoside phosphotransferase family enzyme/predicted kinase
MGEPAFASLHETHISVLALIGDRAYKLKKPVKLDFVDLTSREAREQLCHREVDLNRRLAPDVYLGVADVHGPEGAPCDHLVVMRRMPDDRRLSTLVREGADVSDDLRTIARIVAEFHTHTATSERVARFGTTAAVRERWEATFGTMEPFLDEVVPSATEAKVRTLARQYLDGRAPLFDRRIAEGRVRDGHGDLLAGDIFCLDDGPRILDCVEFDDTLRYTDVAADVAFLAMDLERLGAPELACRFLAWYREFTGETYPATLADHYVALRAHIRSMVACLRAGQGDADARAEAALLLDIACRHLTWGQVPLVLVGGLPGTGKSTLAAALADRFGWTVLRSDETRKELAGMPHAERSASAFREGVYSAQHTDETYATLLHRAGALLHLGEPVILDASWSDGGRRSDAWDVARKCASAVVELRCVAPPAVTAERMHARELVGGDASDATPAVAAAMAARWDDWPGAHVVDTSRSVDATLTDAEAYVRHALEIA